MNENGLTIEDVNVLMGALDAYEREDGTNMMSLLMLKACMPPAPEEEGLSSEERRVKFQKESEEAMAVAREASKGKMEKIILLKAKLVLLKQELSVKEVMGENE